MSEEKKALVIESRVREFVKGDGEGARLGEDFLKELNAKVEALVEASLLRMDANGRKTLRACDL